jgi:hypothetical protein
MESLDVVFTGVQDMEDSEGLRTGDLRMNAAKNMFIWGCVVVVALVLVVCYVAGLVPVLGRIP